MMSLIVLSLACSGCNGALQPTGVIAERTTAWRRVADEDDRERLRDWRATFVKAIEAARREGHGAEIDREGALLNPDGALAGSAIPNVRSSHAQTTHRIMVESSHHEIDCSKRPALASAHTAIFSSRSINSRSGIMVSTSGPIGRRITRRPPTSSEDAARSPQPNASSTD